MRTRTLCLMAALVLSSTPGMLARTNNAPPCQAAATSMEMLKYGPQWLQRTPTEREIYLIGFVDGGSIYSDFMLSQTERVRKDVWQARAGMYDIDVLSPVMTSLYNDPANIYIRYDSIVFIARDKIAEKDIEPVLRIARQRDCGGSRKK